MPRYAARIDKNHREIVRGIQDVGFPVVDLSAVGGGCPDICVPCRGKWWFFEIKDPAKRGHKDEFTDVQREWHEKHNHYAPVYVIYNLSQALKTMGVI